MLDLVAEIVEKIKTHPKVVAIYLFGSHAKGEATPFSDMALSSSFVTKKNLQTLSSLFWGNTLR